MNDIPLPDLSDWNPFWNRSGDLAASRIAKKRAILTALDRLEHDRPETFIVKEGAFTMNIASRLIDNKALLRLRQKARKLPEDKPPRETLPSYPHAQRTIEELEQAAVQIYGNAAHKRGVVRRIKLKCVSLASHEFNLSDHGFCLQFLAVVCDEQVMSFFSKLKRHVFSETPAAAGDNRDFHLCKLLLRSLLCNI